MLEKVQNLKRKVNLEENPGNRLNHSIILTQNDIPMIAKSDVGIKISNELNAIINSIIDRNSTFSSSCKEQECNEVLVEDRNSQWYK
jgi:hypothetical protein